MSRKGIIITAAVAVLVLSLVSAVAIARPGGRMGGGMTGARARTMGGGMGPAFTIEQKEEMTEIREGFDEERVGLTNKMKVMHLEMQELLGADDVDFGKIERMIDNVTELRGEMTKLRLRQHVAIRKILDDDQRVLFDKGFGRILGHGGRGGMMDCGPMGSRGGMMSGHDGMMGGRMMSQHPGMGGERQVEILRMPGGGFERRIVIERIEEDTPPPSEAGSY